MVNMNEFFALPVGNSEVKNSLGLSLYTNPNLKNKYIEIVYNSSKTKKIAKYIENMVDKEKITPVWLNKNIMTTLVYKVFGPNEKERIKKDAYAFYSSSDHKIFIFIDNAMSFGFTDNQLLTDLTVHETMHMGAGELKSRYLKLFEDELDLYYDNLFRKYFAIPVNVKIDTKLIMEWIFKNFESNASISGSVIYKYRDFLHKNIKDLSSLDAKTLDEKIKNYILSIYLALSGRISDIIKNAKFNEVSLSVRQAYSDAFKINPPTNNFYIQELYACSEVISMLSESKTTNAMYSLFKILGS